MHIRANDVGVIDAFGEGEIQGATEYSGNLPDDFLQMAGWGKYRFLNDEIVEVNGFEAPAPSED